MADSIVTIKSNAKKLAKMAAADLADSVQFFKAARKVSKDEFKSDASGHAPGDTISVRIPPMYTVGTTSFDLTSALQDIKERAVDLPLDKIATIGFDLDSQQLAHDIDVGAVYERFVQPAIKAMAASVENQMLQKATQATYNLVGTAGSTVVDPDTVLAGRERMNKYLCPQDNRNFLMDSTAMRSAVNANKNLFVFGKKEYGQGYIGDALGFSWMENELLYNHTNGTDVSGIAVDDAAVATGASTIHLDGITTGSGTLTKGTVFTIANVYAVHPQTKESLGFLQPFTVTATVTASGVSDADVAISPTIYGSGSGSLQNVNSLPADDAAVTILTGSASTAYKQSLMFHKEAFRVCSVPLVLPVRAEFAEQATEDGVNIAIIRDFDVLTRKMITRLDFLGGLVAVRPEWACRVTA